MTVQAMPTPLEYVIGRAQSAEGVNLVVFRLATVLGEMTFFFSPEAAQNIAEKLASNATTAKTGLFVPTQGE